MMNRRAQFFSLYLVALTLFMCVIVIWMYTLGQSNAESSLVSPVETLIFRDNLELFEMREVALIKKSFDVDVDKFRKNFLAGVELDEKMKGFLFDRLVLNGVSLKEIPGFFENVLYPESLTSVSDGKLFFGRARIGKRGVFKPLQNTENYFPVDFIFEFERNYVVSEVDGKIEVEVA